jgi:hypothetical protein
MLCCPVIGLVDIFRDATLCHASACSMFIAKQCRVVVVSASTIT